VKTVQSPSLHSSPGTEKAVAVIEPSFNQTGHQPTNGHGCKPRIPGKVAFRQDVDANHPPDGR